LFTRRRLNVAAPEVGAEAPEFNLPSAQGGQLRLSMRTARGPVVVVFFRGSWSEEDVEYFKALAAKEDEINLSGASVVGIGLVEPDEAREFVRASGIKSMVLYDYVRITTRQWGLSEKDKQHGEYARPAVFVVGTDHKVVHAWTDGLPAVEEIQAKITELTGLPKPAEEADEEKPRRTKKVGTSEAAPGQAAPPDDKPKKMSAEERERIKAERRAAREAGKPVKTPQTEQTPASTGASEGEQAPKKMSKEERERIKAERRAAREAGKSVKTAQPEQESASGEAPAASDAPKKMTAEERERIKAERRAAREAGKSLKKPAAGQEQAAADETGEEEPAPSAEAEAGER
jgi:peroxiredoxin